MSIFYPTLVFSSVAAITPALLESRGIRALILDVDNTLTGHGSQAVPPEVERWLGEMKAAGIGLTIASNNFRRRVEPFARRLGLAYVSMSLKPVPWGLWRARRRLGLPKSAVALVGDQVFTDALGARLYGIQMFLTEPMYPDDKPGIRLRRRLEGPVLRRYFEKGGQRIG